MAVWTLNMIKENRMCDCLKQKALSGEEKMNVTAKRIRCTIAEGNLLTK